MSEGASKEVQAKVQELGFHTDRTNEVRGYVRDFERLVDQLHRAGSAIEQMLHEEKLNPALREDVDALEQIVNRFEQEVERDQEAVREMEFDGEMMIEALNTMISEGK